MRILLYYVGCLNEKQQRLNEEHDEKNNEEALGRATLSDLRIDCSGPSRFWLYI